MWTPSFQVITPEFVHTALTRVQGLDTVLGHYMVLGFLECQWTQRCFVSVPRHQSSGTKCGNSLTHIILSHLGLSTLCGAEITYLCVNCIICKDWLCITLLLLCSLFDLESKPDEIDEDKNRETRSERHKRVSRPRNGNNFLESSLKLAYSSRYYHRGPTEISATGRYDQIKTMVLIVTF